MMRRRYFHWLIGVLFSLVCLLSAKNVFAVTVEPPKNPNSAKGCAICHYRWIDTFFVEGKGTDLVPYQSEKVAAKPEMCISCHDGSIMDSRARMLHGKGHKTDVKPPADMKIPEIFPLDEDGKVQCATCHTAHGVESGPGIEETIFLRISNVNSDMCRMCHPDKDGGTSSGNHSLGKIEKGVPLSLKDLYAHEGKEKNQMICETCHTAHGSPKEGYLVKGAGDGGLCLDCHTEMNMFDLSNMRNANHAINVKPRTAKITEQLQKDGAKLGYGGVFTCQTCHKIHNNRPKEPALLFLNNRKAALCLECHPDKQRLEKTKHNLAVSAKEEKNLEGETAEQAGMCSSCHLPHKAARKPYKKKTDTDRTTGLCMSCHAKGMVAYNNMIEGYMHPVDVTLSKASGTQNENQYGALNREKGILDLPLYNRLGVRDEKGKMTCATCHDTHGGAIIQTPSITEETGGVGEKTTLLRKASPEICRTCHADKFTIEKTRHDLKSTFPDGNSILAENVQEPDLCRNCHRIHSSESEGFVWHKTITTESGKMVYEKCTVCHEKDGLAPEMIVQENSHPVNVPLEGISSTTALPLFNASGNVADDGIMTCYTCHDPHSFVPLKSKSGVEISEKGRPVNRFLRRDIIPDSQLCTACHNEKKAVLLSDHNLQITAPESKNTAGMTPFESGACGACHIVHNGANKISLWAQDLGNIDGAESMMDRMCNSCHAKNKVASSKVPQVSSHPDTIIVSNWKSSDEKTFEFPLYDKVTAKPVPAGNMSCSSCHDPHHWGEKVSVGKTVKNVEGDATTSFLRPHVPGLVCKECHGLDGLFLYKYFHKADKRKK